MSDAETIAALVAPVPGPHPPGIDLRETDTYRRIAEARRQEDARLPRGIWQTELKQADWGAVADLCTAALGQSKDLRVACWLAETWTRREGFGGAAAGFELIEQLIRLYWDVLQPQDGPGFHLAALEWLADRLPIVLRQVPLAPDPMSPERSFGWGDYLNAERLEALRARDPAGATKAEAAGAVTVARFDQALALMPPGTLQALGAALAVARERLGALDAEIDRHAGSSAPSLAAVAAVLRDTAGYLERIQGARAPAVQPDPPRPVPKAATPAPAAPAREPGEPRDRDDAYRQLAQIAAYLERTEPHSPVPYVLGFMVEWGRMPLAELDTVMRANGSNMSLLLDALGLVQE